jgi:UDP-N-acetylglucosamine 1-carboxyvinyltransferase
MAERFIIQGARPLSGVIEARGAKNATFPILAASLLTDKKCLIENLPLIEDVFLMIEILKSMGVKISWQGKHSIIIQAKKVHPEKIRKDLISKFRGSVLFFGPLLARFGQAELPQPGGCLIGARPIFTHLDAFSQLGIKINQRNGSFYLKVPKKIENDKVILNEFSVTATENLLLFCSLLEKEITIKIADADYQVQELAKFLKKMGTEIKGIGTHTLIVKGKRKLKGTRHRILYDPIEAGTFILMAAAVKGRIIVKNVETSFLELFLKRLKDFGLPFKIIKKSTVRVEPWTSLRMEKVQAMPYPGIHTDLLPLFGVLATQTEGLTLLTTLCMRDGLNI